MTEKFIINYRHLIVLGRGQERPDAAALPIESNEVVLSSDAAPGRFRGRSLNRVTLVGVKRSALPLDVDGAIERSTVTYQNETGQSVPFVEI